MYKSVQATVYMLVTYSFPILAENEEDAKILLQKRDLIALTSKKLVNKDQGKGNFTILNASLYNIKQWSN